MKLGRGAQESCLYRVHCTLYTFCMDPGIETGVMAGLGTKTQVCNTPLSAQVVSWVYLGRPIYFSNGRLGTLNAPKPTVVVSFSLF